MNAVKREILPATWEAKYSFSPAVLTQDGKVVWLAGQVGFVDDNHQPLAGDFDAQVRQTFRNIQRVLDKAGGALKDIVSMTVYIVAAGFALPEIMVEVTAYAVVDN